VNQIEAPDLAGPAFKANPYPFYARLRSEAPAYRMKVGLGLWGWLVTRYDDAVLVLKDERFANDWSPRVPWVMRRFGGSLIRHMLVRDPPDHTRLRTLVSKAFTPRLVERLRGRVQGVCDELLDPVPAEGRMELVHAYALPLPLTIIAELLGIPTEDRLRLHAWARTGIGASSGLDLFLAIPSMWRLPRYFRKLFAERRAEPRDDLLTALVQAEEAGDKLDEDELVSMIFLLLVAGYETTVNLLSVSALALLQHPSERESLQQDPGLVASAIEELLRFTSPLEMAMPRYTREDVTIGSVTIPRGELVVAVFGSANHDEAQFPDPERLDLARDPNRHLGLGMGGHFCLGAPLARLEAEIALTTLFRRFPRLRLAGQESVRWRRNLVLRGLERLQLVV
jgi:cytochrome P450